MANRDAFLERWDSDFAQRLATAGREPDGLGGWW